MSLRNDLLEEEVFDTIRKNIQSWRPPGKFKKQKRRKSKKERRRARREKQKLRLKPKVWSWLAYMRSEEWKRRKHAYYQKYGKVCQACGSKQRIHLHHLSYKNLGNEPDEDLVPLCDWCHEELHDLYGTKDLRNNSNRFIIEKSEEATAHEQSKYF